MLTSQAIQHAAELNRYVAHIVLYLATLSCRNKSHASCKLPLTGCIYRQKKLEVISSSRAFKSQQTPKEPDIGHAEQATAAVKKEEYPCYMILQLCHKIQGRGKTGELQCCTKYGSGTDECDAVPAEQIWCCITFQNCKSDPTSGQTAVFAHGFARM